MKRTIFAASLVVIYFILLGLIVAGCYTTPVQQPIIEQEVEDQESITVFTLSDIIQLFKWQPDEDKPSCVE
jgi:hypothetical protein